MCNHFNSQAWKLRMTQPYFQRDSYTRNFMCFAFQPQLAVLIPNPAKLGLQSTYAPQNSIFEFCRDTYSDRSGSSSPDLEITELKFPSVNHDWFLVTFNDLNFFPYGINSLPGLSSWHWNVSCQLVKKKNPAHHENCWCSHTCPSCAEGCMMPHVCVTDVVGISLANWHIKKYKNNVEVGD